MKSYLRPCVCRICRFHLPCNIINNQVLNKMKIVVRIHHKRVYIEQLCGQDITGYSLYTFKIYELLVTKCMEIIAHSMEIQKYRNSI